jgi:hypothetical protein
MGFCFIDRRCQSHPCSTANFASSKWPCSAAIGKKWISCHGSQKLCPLSNRTSEHFTPLHYFLKLGSHIPSEKQFASTEMSASSCLAQGKLAFRELSIAQVQNLCHEVISSMPCGRAHNVIQIHVHCRACYGHAVQVQELTDDAPLLMRGSTLDHLPRVVQ